MYNFQEPWKKRISGALNLLLEESGCGERVDPANVAAEQPPRPEMGDIGFPMFAYAKLLRKGPPQIAVMVCAKLAAQNQTEYEAFGEFNTEGPYVNIRLDRGYTSAKILPEILNGVGCGKPGTLRSGWA